jgi:hypothetical protein
MYKKLVTFLVFGLYAPLAAFSADDPSRARLYIPVATSTTVSGCTTCGVKASGYALDYVFGFGLGLGVASSKLALTGWPTSSTSTTDFSIDTGPMMDIGYTFGSDFTFTLGVGVGSSPTSDKFISGVNYKIEGKSASTSFLGLGYSFGSIEILLALRSSSASFDESYMMSFFGREMMTSWANEYEWQTTDIGIGFTF